MTDLEKYNLGMLARSRSYSPYSKFPVGAVVILKDGTTFLGANIENAAYGLTVCAERNAIFNCIVSGRDPFEIVELICIADTEKPTSPCGSCRQVMAEFMSPDAKITLFNTKQDKKEFLLKELIPYSFTESDLTHEG